LPGRLHDELARVTGHLSVEEIEAILGNANEETSRVFWAHRCGMSYEEIARELHVSYRSIEMQIAHALLLLMAYRGKRK
jgi:DNA-directed RNA polymerase specialized sigma24 family protein